MSMPLLQIRDMRVYYRTTMGNAKVVDGVSFDVFNNEVVGIAGESGCGKSTLVEGVLRIIEPPGYIESGKVISPELSGDTSENADLLQVSGERFRQLRWRRISYIPQGSMNSLNPVLKIEDQIVDTIMTHDRTTKPEAKQRVNKLLGIVGLSADVARLYPHELSGGMKQRVIIAASIALSPRLVVADEPTTALDVTIQKMVLQTLVRIQKEFGCTILLVSHDMPVHAQIADRLVIMYAGKVMEIGSADEVFNSPYHPYTQGLIATIPTISRERIRLEGIPGSSPSPSEWPPGCRFHPRCKHAMDICRQTEPMVRELMPGRYVACHLYNDLKEVDRAARVQL